MRTIETTKSADPDNKLRLEIPVAANDRPYHVVVVIEEVGAPAIASNDWPNGFIEATAGAWQGDLVREPQGQFEERESL